MCTSISSSGGDGTGSGGGGESRQSVVSCMLSKKAKKQKVPKRGPGVAELEKILRQENRRPSSTTVTAAAEAAVGLPPPRTALFSIPSPPRSQLYSGLPHHMTSFPSESSSVSRSAFQFPFSTLVGSNNGGSSDHQMQRTTHHSPTMMNFFPSSSSSAVEPPSNQIRFYPDRPSMIGRKRQCLFYIDAETPSSRFQPPSYPPSFSPPGSHCRTNHDTDSRGNLVLLGSPTTTREHSMFYNPPPPVEGCEGFKNKPLPFYSFLEEPGIISKAALNGEGEGEGEGDGIDLRLKL